MEKRERVTVWERYGFFLPLPERFGFHGVFLTPSVSGVKGWPWLRSRPFLSVAVDEAKIYLAFTDDRGEDKLVMEEEILVWKENGKIFVCDGPEKVKDDLLSFFIQSDDKQNELEIHLDDRAQVHKIFRESFPRR